MSWFGIFIPHILSPATEGDTPHPDEMMELCFHTCFGDDGHVPYVPKSIPLCDRHALEVEQDEYGARWPPSPRSPPPPEPQTFGIVSA